MRWLTSAGHRCATVVAERVIANEARSTARRSCRCVLHHNWYCILARPVLRTKLHIRGVRHKSGARVAAHPERGGGASFDWCFCVNNVTWPALPGCMRMDAAAKQTCLAPQRGQARWNPIVVTNPAAVETVARYDKPVETGWHPFIIRQCASAHLV